MKKVSICLDVGGTYIKGALFSTEFENKYTEIHYYPAKSELSKEKIVENFEYVFSDLLFNYDENDWYVEKIAVAFPGPFDYENGISLIKGLGKFASLYKINLLQEFKKIQQKEENRKIKHAMIFFKNDAEAFAFGENHYSGVKKGAYFTLGTGLGSTFIENKKVVAGTKGIPEIGMIYNQPFKDSIIDDYVSARGLKKIIQHYYFNNLTGAELFKQAEEDTSAALEVFNDFGSTVGEAISPFVSSFCPDEIVLGGQISKSFNYFKDSLIHVLEKENQKITVRISEDTTLRTLEGLFILDK
ncbi:MULTISPECIES: ROK family protein [Enterococcus]|uniref:ROK family protein n=1 Tax=Enterococcus TaxID=1350 RepID=UPI00065DDD4B|nr:MULTISPECIES: ROK family protein [Enterococcus]